MEAEGIDVEAAVGEPRRQVAQVVGERRRLGIGVDEDERPPRSDGDRHEGQRRAVEARFAVRAWRAPQRSVEAVRPCVVRALDRLPPVVALAERMPAVPADVDEPAQLAVAGAREDDRQCSRVGGGQLAGRGDLIEACCVLPAAREDPLLLDTQHRRVGVPVVRQRPGRRSRRHRVGH